MRHRQLRDDDGVIHQILGEEYDIQLGILCCHHWYSRYADRAGKHRDVAEATMFGRTSLRGDTVDAPVTCLWCWVT